MGKDNRVTYRRRHSYNTRSNRIRKVKTPGGKLAVQYVTKAAKGVACGDCGNALQGVRALLRFLCVPVFLSHLPYDYVYNPCRSLVRDLMQ